jgi:hypothetical protein
VAWPLIRILELEEDRIVMIHTHSTVRQNHELITSRMKDHDTKSKPLARFILRRYSEIIFPVKSSNGDLN